MAQTPDESIAALRAEVDALRAQAQDLRRSLSHDLRADLRHILSYSQMLQEDLGEQLDPQARGFLDTVCQAARNMGDKLDALMELARLGTVALDMQPVHLQPLVRSLADAIDRARPERSIDWQLDGDWPWVSADPALLSQCLRQLLDNAVKFTAAAPQARIRLHASQHGAAVQLHIVDNGVGFNPGQAGRLFHPFQRLHHPREFPGLGVGLAQAQKIVQRLGGTIALEGVAGAGCTVRIALQALT